MAKASPGPAQTSGAFAAVLPVVRLEVRPPQGQSAVYEVGDGAFLIGSVAGCDLHLAGPNPAPVMGLITRHGHGATLRSLASVQPVHVNGKPVGAAYLQHGDHLSIAGVQILCSITAPPPAPAERRLENLAAQEAEMAGARKELKQLRQELAQRYQEKRQRLDKQHEGIRKAAGRLRDRKQQLDSWATELQTHQQHRDGDLTQLQAARDKLQRDRQTIEEQHRLIASQQQEVQRGLVEQFQDLQQREKQLAGERAALDKSQKQHQSDLVRLDRIQGLVEVKLKRLQQHALQVDHRYEQLQRDSRDLEEQAVGLDDWRQRVTADEAELARRKQAQETEEIAQAERAAALESQQAMLATLRTRLERMREDLQQQEQALAQQRDEVEAAQNDLRGQLEQARLLRLEVENDRQLHEQERKRFGERHATLEAAVAQLRQTQETLATQEASLHQKQEFAEALATEQAEQAQALQARGTQLDEQQARLAAETQALQEREANLLRSEQALAALQEQVRKRSEELNERQQQLAELEQRLHQQTADLERAAEATREQETQARQRRETASQEMEARRADLEQKREQLQGLDQILRQEQERLAQREQALARDRQAWTADKTAWESERQAAHDALAKSKADAEAALEKSRELGRMLPELEIRAADALQRLERSRALLREHLAEIHGFALKGREELDLARQQVREEADRLRQQDQELQAGRDEHRLAVAAFRHQLLEWQARVEDMQKSLKHDENRLDRRAAEVQQKAQELEATGSRLAQQAEQLQQTRQQVESQRDEMTRHLGDMREWYRRKLRELSGVDLLDRELPAADGGEADVPGAGEHDILSISGTSDPGDRQLGELLTSLELVDADTLTALLQEARRQRRSLRQLLLAGNYLTLYQMALIEAGNLDGLVLGPVRVIDRLQSTPREAVYRVFDPRSNGEAVLRHLAEAEMEDAVRPDEFLERFRATAAVRHTHVAATYEVLDIAGRPAVLQEWLTGLPGSDWPALAAAPGVWFRLVSQAALAVQTVHAAGLVHGNLQPASFVFTSDGLLKLTGLGEPRWLLLPAPAEDTEPTAEADLEALGPIIAAWAALAPRKGSKPKPLPDSLQAIVDKLQVPDPAQGYASATALLDDLDSAGADVPANTTAWERFVREVRDRATSVALRRSA
jgi:chromosome segregation ATPase